MDLSEETSSSYYADESLEAEEESEIKETADPSCPPLMCNEIDFECIYSIIENTICRAKNMIASDQRGLFFYKCTHGSCTAAAEQSDMIQKSISVISDHHDSIEWCSIRDFSYQTILTQIRFYIGQWRLAPETKCVVLSNQEKETIPQKGEIYYVDAHFSKPTPRCPNPLAVAKVRFIITVPEFLPKHYNVMVAYRFEGYNTLYYALGTQSINSLTFQRFYVDTILHMKLAFYAEFCECRHGPLKPKQKEQNADNE